MPVEASGPSTEDIEARLGRHAPKDSPLGQSLTGLIRADPAFDPGHFLDQIGLAQDVGAPGRRACHIAVQGEAKRLQGAALLGFVAGSIVSRSRGIAW